MKKLWISMLLLCLLGTAALAEEEPEHVSGPYAYSLDEEGNATLEAVRWEAFEAVPETLALPAELDGHPVTALGDAALNTWDTMAQIPPALSIIVPEGVVRFEGDPFLCCHEAGHILLPATLTEIAEGSFFHVEADITVAPDNPAFAVQDGYLIDTRTSTLLYCAMSVADAPLPAVRRIGDSALCNWGWACENWPEDGEGLTLTIPEGVEEIGSGVIYDSVHISRLILPDSLMQLVPKSFYCTALTDVAFGKGLTAIPEGAFLECWGLRDVVLPETVTFVGCEAFYLPEGTLTALNPDCHFETLEEYLLRLGEDADPMIGGWDDWIGE